MTNRQLVRGWVEGQVATLSLNRPAKLNALVQDTFIELRAHLYEFAHDPKVSCLVLTGEGRSFCAGLDLTAAAGGTSTGLGKTAAETIDLLESFPHPTIARINGHCLTGGLELALACDLLICASDARLGDTHGRWGMVPAWGMSIRLPERIGVAAAMELSFTGEVIDGDQAAAIGLVNRSVAPEDLDDVVASTAARITANSRESNRIYKRLYRSPGALTRRRALEFERSLPFGLPSDLKERMHG